MACAVVVCAPPPPQQQQQQLPAKCLFGGSSFNVSRVSVSLKLNPRPRQLPSRQSHDDTKASDDGFLFLAMAAAADGGSFPPYMLQQVTQFWIAAACASNVVPHALARQQAAALSFVRCDRAGSVRLRGALQWQASLFLVSIKRSSKLVLYFGEVHFLNEEANWSQRDEQQNKRAR